MSLEQQPDCPKDVRQQAVCFQSCSKMETNLWKKSGKNLLIPCSHMSPISKFAPLTDAQVQAIQDGLVRLGWYYHRFRKELDYDIEIIHDEHRSIEDRYKSALRAFNGEWNRAKKSVEEPFYTYGQQDAYQEAAKLCVPVEAFMNELQNLLQASEVEISYPEIAFKKDLNSLGKETQRYPDQEVIAACGR